MIRIAIRIAWVLLAALGISIPLIAVSLPANAASTFTICELSGKFCAGAPTLAAGDAVSETTSGRLVIAVKQINAFEGHTTYLIEFNANTNLCIGVDGLNVDVESCTGNGVVWALVHPGGVDSQDEWINRATSQHLNKDAYLSGSNKGNGFFLADQGFNGAYQKFLERF
jgi:hypothetical protein